MPTAEVTIILFLFFIATIFTIGLLERNYNSFRRPESIKAIIMEKTRHLSISEKHRSAIFNLNESERIVLELSLEVIFVRVERYDTNGWTKKESTLSFMNSEPVKLKGPWKKSAYELLKNDWNQIKFL